jgi:sulfur carrier protein ThiS
VITQISSDGHRVDLVGHRITASEAATVAKVLAAEGLRVEPTEPDFEGVVHLWAKTPLDTLGRVRVLRAFQAVTDGPLAFHQGEA